MAGNNRSRENRRRVRQRRRRIKRMIYLGTVGLIILIIIAIFCVRKNVKDKKETTAISQEQAREEKKKAEEAKKKAEEEKKQKTIKKVLDEDKYGERLEALYTKYPEVENILLNREAYPDWLVEYFITHEEAVDWVVEYPDYAAKPAEEINSIALEPIDLKDYYVRRNIPIYYQWDQKWGYASYGSGTIAVEGCGPTCLSMVAVGLTGDTSYTPKRVADISIASGYYTEEYGTDWTMMTKGSTLLGLRSYQIMNWSVGTLVGELSAGHPIICSMGPGEFTSQGHFVVLTGLEDDGTIIVNDPNSRINSRKKWNPQQILDQMEGAWSFSVM